jgi:hypothetical protein
VPSKRPVSAPDSCGLVALESGFGGLKMLETKYLDTSKCVKSRKNNQFSH